MRRTHHLRLGCFAAVLLAAAGLRAQTIEVPRPAPGQALPPQVSDFDSKHLKDRPYSLTLPKPQFPSTDRVQREFVVEYVYDYAFSNYTPEVKMAMVPPAQMKRDTPEDAAIAFFSAMRAGDYDNWLKGWDEAAQKQFAQNAKDKKQDAAFWKKVWGQMFAGVKDVYLVDRVETQNYVILDARFSGPDASRLPSVFKLVDGKWLATNDLSINPMLYLFHPALAGILNRIPPMPVADMDQENPQQAQAQQHFLDEHTVRSMTVETGH